MPNSTDLTGSSLCSSSSSNRAVSYPKHLGLQKQATKRCIVLRFGQPCLEASGGWITCRFRGDSASGRRNQKIGASWWWVQRSELRAEGRGPRHGWTRVRRRCNQLAVTAVTRGPTASPFVPVPLSTVHRLPAAATRCTAMNSDFSTTADNPSRPFSKIKIKRSVSCSAATTVHSETVGQVLW
jgi:hypothetical protein